MIRSLSSPHNPIALFNQHVPAAFQEHTLRCLRQSYAQAYEHCDKEYPPEEAHDLRPHDRRAKFEAKWREIAKQFPELSATPERNKARNSHHTRVVCGPVVLTASAVDNPRTLVRKAAFRETYARDNQTYLFDSYPAPKPGAALYAILIHGPAMHNQGEPYFADIVFPAPDCQSYVDRIPLFEKFRDIAAQSTLHLTEEIIPDEAQPRLRAGKREEA